MKAYCFKCRKQRNVKNVEHLLLGSGRRAIKGICSHCETKVYSILKDVEPEPPPWPYPPDLAPEVHSGFEHLTPPTPTVHG
jgi:hypothetical protein